MFVSFVIPVYKVEEYISNCVQSLIRQTFKDFEIILVDDGSPDNCPRICDELASHDSRIKVIHKENGGLSDARNSGLATAKGDYVIFIDSDDFWLHESDLGYLYDELKDEPFIDMLQFNCTSFYPNGQYKEWKQYSSKLASETDKERIINLLVATGVIPMSACLKVLKRDFLINNSLYFEKGILCEDIPWFVEVLIKAKKIKFVNRYIYAYRQNVEGSISNSFSLRTFEDLFKIVKKIAAEIPTFNLQDATKRSLFSFMAYEFCILLSNINKLPVELQEMKREELLNYKWLLQYKENPKVRLVNYVTKVVGIRMTERILRYYQNNH